MRENEFNQVSISLFLFLFLHSADDKYNLQNYSPLIGDQSQSAHHYAISQYKALDHKSNSSNQHEKLNTDEPNNNSKNNSSSSSYEDTIDYDDSIQNHDLKEAQMLKRNDYMKNFPNRVHYEEHQQNNPTPYNGNANADDYRMTNIDDRKMGDDGNSNDMRMNYASSEEMNQNTVSSDHGEKLGSGSEDEGKKFL